MLDYPDWYLRANRFVANTRLGNAMFQTYYSPTVWQSIKSIATVAWLGKKLVNNKLTPERTALAVSAMLALYYSNTVHSAKSEIVSQMAEAAIEASEQLEQSLDARSGGNYL